MAETNGTGSLISQGTELASAYLDLKNQYDLLVRKNLAGVFRTTVQGRFVECNDAMARMLGYKDREALMSVHAGDLYVEADARQRFLDDLRKHGQLVNYEIALKRIDGRTVHVLENVFLNEQADRSTTIDGTLIDITAIRQGELEQRALLNNYRQLMDRVRDAILIVRDDRVLYANPSAEALVPEHEWLGRSFIERLHVDDRATVQEAIDLHGSGSSSGIIDVRVDAGSGTWRDMLLSAAVLQHEGGIATQVTLQDVGLHRSLVHERSRARMAEEVNEILRQEIIEHRRTQEALRQSRRFARSLVDSSLDTIIAVDQQGRITEFNPAAAIKFGYDADEVMGQRTDMLYADEAEYKRVQQEMNAHGAFAGEVINITRDGRAFTCFLVSSRLYDEDGKLLGTMGVGRDITQIKRDQEALRASEERYRDLFENATDLIQSVDIEGVFQYANDTWCRTLGYTKEEVGQLRIEKIIHPDDLAEFTQWRVKLFAGEQPVPITVRFRAKDGRTVIVLGSSTVRSVEGRPVATRSIFRDITAEQTALEEVQEHEAQLRALFESSEHMFWSVDRRIAITSFNRGYGDMIERLYGIRPEVNTDPTTPRKRFASAAYHAFWEEKYAEAFNGKAMRFETDVTDREGRRVCNEIFLSPVFGIDGTVDEVFGVGHEITEQKEAEDLVREQAARLKAIFENSANMMIWTLDHDYRITSMNEHFVLSNERAMGIRFELGDNFIKHLMDRVADKRYQPVVDKFAMALSGKPQQFEVELKNHAGRSLWVENFLNPITLDGQVVEISCQAFGITDKKESQRKLLDSLHEKEVLLKEVHHRVKNNLQIISSIFNLQKQYVDDHPRTLELLRDSQDRIRSMSFIHESLYQTKNFSHVDLAAYIEGLTRNLMMSYSLNGKVELELDLRPVELVLDQAIPCGLILNELIGNALKHAFPDGAAGRIAIGLHADGDQVRIRVTDDGRGMPPDFDHARHANLGLELVDTLIGQLDGHIERSNPAPGRSQGVSYLITFGRTGLNRNI
ncbi:MAG TPA: PAS domain S-box protein [Flavobacteriales bacterium]|nr:PAS domain S-box protein [Flavobacteriales bacterium]HNK84870.1 PAS domain S-box protein [Flavobacteriales bacterium]HNM68318.1 PAS domain S-box protein [Flavobacteriales bacterium]